MALTNGSQSVVPGDSPVQSNPLQSNSIRFYFYFFRLDQLILLFITELGDLTLKTNSVQYFEWFFFHQEECTTDE